jgi:hypothetical protein
VRQRLLETLQAERAAEQRERIADAFTSVIGKAVDCEIPESLLNELGSQQYRWAVQVDDEAAAGGGGGTALGGSIVLCVECSRQLAMVQRDACTGCWPLGRRAGDCV